MAPSAQSRHKTVDGGLIDLTGPGDFSTQWAAYADIAVGPVMREVAGGPVQWGFEVAEGAGVSLDERYSYRGGDLHFGKASRSEAETGLTSVFYLAVWVGGGFAVKVHGFESASDVIGFFDNFDFTGHPEGVELRIKPHSTFSVVRSKNRSPVYFQNVPGMGIFEVKQLTREKRKDLPTWPGSRVKGGQLYVEDGPDPENWTLLLVSGTALTRLYPNYWEASSEDIVDRFSEATVEWT